MRFPELRSAGWAPKNKERIERFLRERGIGSPGYDPAHPPCATFDWDMTSIFNDVGDAHFFYQVQNLYLKLTPAELEALIPDKLQKTGASLADEKREVVEAYKALGDARCVGPFAAMPIDAAVRNTLDVFAYRMVWLYNQLEAIDGAPVAYPWLVKLYAHLEPAELGRLSELVLAKELLAPGDRCTTEKLVHPKRPELPPIEIRHGIVASPEMRELYAALRAHGFDVYVVTASFHAAVEPIAARYGVRTDHVIGMRLQGFDVPEPITYRAGKVDNIKKLVPAPPLFAAGDSDTDVEMLLQPSVELRLILDRKKKPTSDIGKLYDRARSTDTEHWLIQGRDDYGADGTASGLWNGTTETRSAP